MLVKVYNLLNFVLRTQAFFSQYREPAWLSRSLVNILTSTYPIHIQLVNQARPSLTLQKSERGSSRCYGLTGFGCLVYLTRSIMALLHSTILYYGHGYTSLYFTLHFSTMALLHFTLFYHGSTSLYFTVYIILPWLYLWLIIILLDSTLLYHGSILYYLTLHYSAMTLLLSILLYHSSTSLHFTLH